MDGGAREGAMVGMGSSADLSTTLMLMLMLMLLMVCVVENGIGCGEKGRDGVLGCESSWRRCVYFGRLLLLSKRYSFLRVRTYLRKRVLRFISPRES